MAVVAANGLLIAASVALGVSMWTLLLVYWIDSAVIGLAALRGMARRGGGSGMRALAAPLATFWLSWTLHGIFVLAFPAVMTLAEEPVGPPVTVDPTAVLGAAALLLGMRASTSRRRSSPTDLSRTLAWRFTTQTAMIILGSFGAAAAAGLGVIGAALPVAARDVVETAGRPGR